MRPLALTLYLLILLSVDLAHSNAPSSTSSYLSAIDRDRLKKLIEPGLSLEDLSSVYHTIVGYKYLEEVTPNAQDICKYLKTFTNEGNAILPENAFYVITIWKTINTCQGLPTKAITEALTNVVEKDSASVLELYHAVSALAILSQKLPDEKAQKIVKILQTALKKDDNLWTLGYTFHIAAELGQAGLFAFDHIEDAVIQADEVDGQFLQFEGGLSITGHIINGIFKLSTSLKKKPPISPEQIVKFANYLLSRRSVQTPKGVVSLLSAITTLANNQYSKPICITLPDGGLIISNQQPLLTVKVCDILGKPLSTVPKVVATSAIRVGDDTAIFNDETLQSITDKTLFTMDFMKIKPERGFYKISIAAGSVTNTLTVKVLSAVTVDYLEIGAADADQTTQPKLSRVAFPEKLHKRIEADSQQKLVIRFLLRDTASKKPIRVHQAFVRLSSVYESTISSKRGEEIIFVAEPDTSNVYKFDMHMNSAAVNFDYQSGDYNVELIVGDAVLSNPFKWTLATASLKFPEPLPSEVAADKNASFKQKLNLYMVKPEIKHMFREPEKRPPAFVSNLFTGLCIAPVFLLIALWIKLGVNISNFPLSISAITFHLGLGSIFVLFGIFWLKLNMFETLRYLLGLGLVTFLAGNKLLSHVAQRHKSTR